MNPLPEKNNDNKKKQEKDETRKMRKVFNMFLINYS